MSSIRNLFARMFGGGEDSSAKQVLPQPPEEPPPPPSDPDGDLPGILAGCEPEPTGGTLYYLSGAEYAGVRQLRRKLGMRSPEAVVRMAIRRLYNQLLIGKRRPRFDLSLVDSSAAPSVDLVSPSKGSIQRLRRRLKVKDRNTA